MGRNVRSEGSQEEEKGRILWPIFILALSTHLSFNKHLLGNLLSDRHTISIPV